MNLRRCLTIVTAIFTLALTAWSILEIIQHGATLWALAVLVYLALVGVTLWGRHDETAANAAPAPLAPQAEGGGENGQTEKTAQEIILNAIRTKGKARRHDLLPQVGLSRSSLGRLLDQMEGKGLIRQEGERKSSYSVLAEKSGPNL